MAFLAPTHIIPSGFGFFHVIFYNPVTPSGFVGQACSLTFIGGLKTHLKQNARTINPSIKMQKLFYGH